MGPFYGAFYEEPWEVFFLCGDFPLFGWTFFRMGFYFRGGRGVGFFFGRTGFLFLTALS